MRIFLLNSGTVQDFYRVFLPAKNCAPLLAGEGIHVHVGPFLEAGYDAYVISRLPPLRHLSCLEHLRSIGKKIIWSIDDDMWSVPPPVPVDLSVINWLRQIAWDVWVSTAPLREVVGRGTVLPNLVDVDFWPKVDRPVNDRVRVLWAGAALGHSDDLKLVAELFEELLQRDVLCLFFGSYPSSMSEWAEIPGSDMALKVPAERYAGKVGFIRPVPLEDYPSTMLALNPDICVAALADTTFNKSRSNLKVLEYSMLGAATVACGVPYENTWAVGLDQMDRLLDNDSLRRGFGLAARQWVMTDWTWTGPRKQKWLDAFRKVANG